MVKGLDHSPLPSGWYGAPYPEDDDTPRLAQPVCLPVLLRPSGQGHSDLLIGVRRAKELIPLDDEKIKGQLLGAARWNAPPGSPLPGNDQDLVDRVHRSEEALFIGTPEMLTAVADISGYLPGRTTIWSWHAITWGGPSVNGALSSGYSAAIEAADLLKSRAN